MQWTGTKLFTYVRYDPDVTTKGLNDLGLADIKPVHVQVMYDQLLDADLVVADITTHNFNAAFELGVRFALRLQSTLVTDGGKRGGFRKN